MKWLALGLFVAATACAQSAPSVTSACGPEKFNYDVELTDAQHSLAPVEAGKARIYLLQDIAGGLEHGFGVFARVTAVGLDGAWVGANKNNSYFSLSLSPGEHHFCFTGKSHVLGSKPVYEFVGLNVEAGKVYYLRIRDFLLEGQRLEIAPTNEDQALYMISSYPVSSIEPHK